MQVKVKDLTALLEETQYGRTNELERLHQQVHKLQKQNDSLTVSYFQETKKLKAREESVKERVVQLSEQSTASNMRWAGEITYLMGAMDTLKRENRRLNERLVQCQKSLVEKGQMSLLDRLLR